VKGPLDPTKRPGPIIVNNPGPVVKGPLDPTKRPGPIIVNNPGPVVKGPFDPTKRPGPIIVTKPPVPDTKPDVPPTKKPDHDPHPGPVVVTPIPIPVPVPIPGPVVTPMPMPIPTTTPPVYRPPVQRPSYVAQAVAPRQIITAPQTVQQIAAPTAYPLVCKSGGQMTAEVVGNSQLTLRFAPGTDAAGATAPAPGQCAWFDRAFQPNEPSTLSVGNDAAQTAYLIDGVKSGGTFYAHAFNNGATLVVTRTGQ
jgi:hypothetical protein